MDAVFAPTREIRDAVRAVARDHGVGLVAPEQVFERIARYYPHERVPPRTRFLVEELLGAAGGAGV